MVKLFTQNEKFKSSVSILQKFYAHTGPVWAVRWRPKTHQLTSCGGLSIFIWNLVKGSSASEEDKEDTNHHPTWHLETILYNETEHPSLLFPNGVSFPYTTDEPYSAFRKETSIDVYESNIHSVNSGTHTRTIRNLCWSNDGRYLAAVSFDSTASIWRELDQKQDVKEFDQNESHSLDIATNHPEPGRPPTWECISHLEGHEHEVKCIAWNPDATQLATCSRDKTVIIHSVAPSYKNINDDTQNGSVEFACSAVLAGHTQDVKCVVWHPLDDFVISCSYDNTIRLWSKKKRTTRVSFRSQREEQFTDTSDYEAEWECTQTLTGHNSTVWDLSFAPDGYSFVSCSDDKTLRIWTCHTSESRNTFSTNHQTPTVSHECQTPTIPKDLMKPLVKTGAKSIARSLFLVQPGFRPVSSSTAKSSLSLSPSTKQKDKEFEMSMGKLTKANIKDCAARLPDIHSDKWYCQNVVSGYHGHTIYSVSWHPTLNIIATGCADNALRLFRLVNMTSSTDDFSTRDWILEIEILNAHTNDINSVGWKLEPESDGSWLLSTAGDDRVVHIYRYSAGSCT